MNVEQELGDPQLTIERALSLYIAVLQKKRADAKIVPVSAEKAQLTLPDGKQFTVSIGNLWVGLRNKSGKERLAAFEHHMTTLISLFEDQDQTLLQPDRIVPTIRD